MHASLRFKLDSPYPSFRQRHSLLFLLLMLETQSNDPPFESQTSIPALKIYATIIASLLPNPKSTKIKSNQTKEAQNPQPPLHQPIPSQTLANAPTSSEYLPIVSEHEPITASFPSHCIALHCIALSPRQEKRNPSVSQNDRKKTPPDACSEGASSVTVQYSLHHDCHLSSQSDRFSYRQLLKPLTLPAKFTERIKA